MCFSAQIPYITQRQQSLWSKNSVDAPVLFFITIWVLSSKFHLFFGALLVLSVHLYCWAIVPLTVCGSVPLRQSCSTFWLEMEPNRGCVLLWEGVPFAVRKCSSAGLGGMERDCCAPAKPSERPCLDLSTQCLLCVLWHQRVTPLSCCAVNLLWASLC